MSNLSSEQQDLKNSIRKSAIIWGVILGGVAGAITFWLTADMAQDNRTQITGMVAGGVGFLLFWLISRSGAKSSKCEKCSASFSISRTNREENLVSSEEKSEHEKLENGGSKLTTWIEEKFDVVETFACSSCDNITTKNSQTTRKKDEIVREKGTRSDDGRADDAPAEMKQGLTGKASGKAPKPGKSARKSKPSK